MGPRQQPGTLIVLSETKFAVYFGWQLHFVTNASGAATDVVFDAPEPDVRGCAGHQTPNAAQTLAARGASRFAKPRGVTGR